MNSSPEGTAIEPKPATWRQSKWLALVEITIFGLIFLADKKHLIPVSETPFLLAFAWITLRVRRRRWRDVGLTRYRSWARSFALGIGAGLLMEGIELFVSQPLLVRFTGRQPDLSDFQAVHPNVKLLLFFVVLSWTLAAFGEEMVWRGYLMNRVADLMNRTRLAWIVSLIVVHVGFGLGHSYQGITGIIDEGLMGVLLGLLYLGTERNLSVPIIAHGVSDTVDMLLIFFGRYPGIGH
ncbi:MAG TPA: type II CAAX endopeptidase family protein [Terriglobales bacterium]|jgi:membrane protease YdiL (CAAX protease family)|nr:type II CAAX endopeptidase family protein [Terriglobales bacterium]